MRRILREVKLFLSALGFLTRVPVPGWTGFEADRLARSSRYFPLVGLVTGGVMALVWLGAGSFLAPLPAAFLAVGAGVMLTGALHEDGFADCCDGLGGGRSKARALEIMRDSRIGAYGAIGLIIMIGLKVALLASFSPVAGAIALLIAASCGRAAMVLMLAIGHYARPDGAASGAGGVSAAEAVFALLIAFAIGASGGAMGIAAVLAALITGWLWLLWLDRKLGGYTGDGLGAACISGEIAVLICLAGSFA